MASLHLFPLKEHLFLLYDMLCLLWLLRSGKARMEGQILQLVINFDQRVKFVLVIPFTEFKTLLMINQNYLFIFNTTNYYGEELWGAGTSKCRGVSCLVV